MRRPSILRRLHAQSRSCAEHVGRHVAVDILARGNQQPAAGGDVRRDQLAGAAFEAPGRQ